MKILEKAWKAVKWSWQHLRRFLVWLWPQVQRLFSWWVGKVKSSSSLGVGALWLFGGLCAICMVCSVPVAIVSPLPTPTVEVTQVGELTKTAKPTVTKVSPTAVEEIAATPEQEVVETIQATRLAREEPTATQSVTSIPTEEPTATVPLVTVANPQLNARTGPSTAYPIITRLTEGEQMPAIGYNIEKTWVQAILQNGQTGWMSADFLRIENEGALTTITDIPAAPTATLVPQSPPASNDSIDSPPSNSTENTENSQPFQCIGGCATPPDGSCEIKGNVNSKNDRIYHVPGGQYYNRTDIKAEEGDRWFCTRAEAEAAGFRASKR
jgi:uncharacterized protein YraI